MVLSSILVLGTAGKSSIAYPITCKDNKVLEETERFRVLHPLEHQAFGRG
jgi:hypothetical protein